MLISSVASLIDTIVVSAFMGPVAPSTVNICMPIYSILTAVGFLIIGGVGTIYGKQLGAGDKEAADKTFTLAFVSTVVLGAIYSLLGIFFTDSIISFLGADPAKEEFFNMSLSYGRELFKKGLLI